MWARRRVAELSRDPLRVENTKEITQLGLDYGIMTQFTSFVAVEEKVVTSGGRMRKTAMPVAIPEEVRPQSALLGKLPSSVGSGGGVGAGSGGSFSSAVFTIAAPAAAGKLPVPTPKLDASLHGLLHTDGSVHVQVLLRDASEATLEELRKSGLVITREPARDLLVQGTIAAGKLADLARLSSVRYVVRLSR
jgi:hypothetical protein